MPEEYKYTRAECLLEIKLELGKRASVYPRWVDAGKMSPEIADRQIAIMEQIAQVVASAMPDTEPLQTNLLRE